MEKLKNYLFELCSETAPSGKEDLLLSLERLVRPYVDECYRDNAGNLIAVKRSKFPGAKKLMLDAHADEVGLVVKGIDDNGFIHFANHTGIDSRILPASTVTVIGKTSLTGVVATLPPHLLKDADTKKVIKTDEMVIDIGFDANKVDGLQAIITPIEIAGERLGTLFLYRKNEMYSIDDIILCEYGTTVVGLEMLRAVNEENAEEIRKVADVQSAINTRSVSEMEAIVHIFEELNGMEGVLVASKIADRVGITRSVIVNALRKFESAGVIVSKSSGMKGTYIKVVNDAVYEEIERLKK